MLLSAWVLVACLLQADVKPAAPLLVLSATGHQRDGLPQAVPHPEPTPYLQGLTRGFPHRLLRLYQLEQRFIRPHQAPQPAVLVLTDNQGGFPRWGLYVDRAQPKLAYVDLHRRQRPTGFRSVEHIFPHELLHVIVRDLAGEHPEGHATQVHAVGVKTDRITAFNEGFAEHAQLMVAMDPDAPAATRGPTPRLLDVRSFDAYRRALAAPISIVPRAQITFPIWWSTMEQAQRYDGVRHNAFAREPDVPRHLYSNRRAYAAYLLENTLPGALGGAPKSVARLLATEGVVAALFYRIVTDAAIQRAYEADDFYARFGVAKSEVAPLENAYLKVFAAIRQGGYDTARVIGAHERLFPQDAAALRRITQDVFLGQPFTPPGELWVLNESVAVGTSLFDQYRGLPRAPAFDLNAASRADLVAVPGVTLDLAERMMSAAPFSSIDDLRRVDGISPDVVARFQQMRSAMLAPPPPGTDAEGGLTLESVLIPYAWRAGIAWLVCAVLGAVLYRLVRRVRAWRFVLNGVAASAVALLAGWTIDPGIGVLALAAPLGIFGLPGSLIRGIRTRTPREGIAVLTAWAAAALPAVIAVTPLFAP